jgi:sialic acid synthase SpsE
MIPRDPLYLYAETAFHHEGDFDFLLRLVRTAAEVGSQGIKFQILIETDALLSRAHASFERFTTCVFTRAQWLQAIALAKELGLGVVALPLDAGAFDVVREAGDAITHVDVHSVSFYDEGVMRALRETGKPVILGVGGRTLEEIDEKQRFFGDQLRVLMVGFQAFPTALADVRLERLLAYKERYPQLTLGYADHSAHAHEHAIVSNEWAWLLGARVFEKHLALDEGAPRLDSESAVGPAKLRETWNRLRALEAGPFADHGAKLFELTEPERVYRERQRAAVCARDLPEGHVLAADDLLFRMTGQPGGHATPAPLVGRALRKALPAWATITDADLA